MYPYQQDSKGCGVITAALNLSVVVIVCVKSLTPISFPAPVIYIQDNAHAKHRCVGPTVTMHVNLHTFVCSYTNTNTSSNVVTKYSEACITKHAKHTFNMHSCKLDICKYSAKKHIFQLRTM